MAGRPSAEIDITPELVQRLLDDQFPQLAELRLEHFAGGWDNEVFRLGNDLLVRLPRREIGARLVVHEQQSLGSVAERLPVPVPAPLHIGKPTREFPWTWSIVPWFDGTEADRSPPSAGQVDVVAQFLRALHQPAPDDAPRNEMRGVRLAECRARTEPRLIRLKRSTELVSPTIERAWERGLAAPVATVRRWLHGDLHSQNVLVLRGKISAIIDWGDISGGDAATDLVVAWSLFETRADRERLLEQYRPEQALLERGIAWTVFFGAVLLESGLVNSPRHAEQGRLLLTRLAEDLR